MAQKLQTPAGTGRPDPASRLRRNLAQGRNAPTGAARAATPSEDRARLSLVDPVADTELAPVTEPAVQTVSPPPVTSESVPSPRVEVPPAPPAASSPAVVETPPAAAVPVAPAPQPVAPAVTPEHPDPAGTLHDYRTTQWAPAPAPVRPPIEEEPVAPEGATRMPTVRISLGPDAASRSLSVSRAVQDRMEDWAAQQRRIYGRNPQPTKMHLVHAALHDLPTDMDGIRDLVGTTVSEVFDGARRQVFITVTPEVDERVRLVKETIQRAHQMRDTPPWWVVSAAIARQLEAEGMGFGTIRR